MVLDQVIHHSLTVGTLFGLGGAALSVASFLAKSMLPLRMMALGANLFFILYGVLEPNLVTLALHIGLLPINAKRAFDIRRLIRQIESARSDTPIQDWLLPHMTKRTAKAGTTLWKRGDKAREMLYVHSGSVRLVEYNETLPAGTLVGEIGLFAPDNRRSLSLECATDCELYSLTAEGMYKLYYQNPKLGFHIMRLVVGRLQRDAETARAARSTPAGPSAAPAATVLSGAAAPSTAADAAR